MLSRIRRQIGDLRELHLSERPDVVFQVVLTHVMCHQGAVAVTVECHPRNFGPFANRVRLEPDSLMKVVTSLQGITNRHTTTNMEHGINNK